MTLRTGDRFHSIPICVVVINHVTTQKMEPLASIVTPCLSWKFPECFFWLCFALICWKLWILTLLNIFLAKGNIMKVWRDSRWSQLLGYFLVDTWKTKDEQWLLICIHSLSLWMFLPQHLSSVLSCEFWHHDVSIWVSALHLISCELVQLFNLSLP